MVGEPAVGLLIFNLLALIAGILPGSVLFEYKGALHQADAFTLILKWGRAPIAVRVLRDRDNR